MRRTPIPVDYIRECFSYVKKTGHLIWKERPISHFASPAACTRWNTRYAHTRAGKPDEKGRRWVSLRNVGMLLVARVIWAWCYGIDPGENIVDHKDTDPSNDSFRNLRLATRSQNQFNQKTSVANSSGIKGVYYQQARGKYVAMLKIAGKSKYLGSFDTAECAGKEVARVRRKLHKEFANHG